MYRLPEPEDSWSVWAIRRRRQTWWRAGNRWPCSRRQTLNWVIGSPGQCAIWVIFHARVTGSSFWPGGRAVGGIHSPRHEVSTVWKRLVHVDDVVDGHGCVPVVIVWADKPVAVQTNVAAAYRKPKLNRGWRMRTLRILFFSKMRTFLTYSILANVNMLAIKTAKVTFKVTQGGAIRWDACDFLIVFHCNYIVILYRFWGTSTYFRKF